MTRLTALVAGLAATTMLFSAFISAYIVRRGISDDWTALSLPAVLYASVLPGAAVSLAVERGLLRVGAALGILFGAMQLYAWRQLGSTGPAAAFFFVLDGTFLAHVAAGIVALLPGVRGDTIRYYWLYLNVLWVVLLAFLSIWR